MLSFSRSITILKSTAVMIKIFGPIDECFSTAGTRPGTGTWRPSYRDFNYFWNFEMH